MAILCKQCERPLLPDDKVCWHCGHPVADGGKTAVSEPNQTEARPQLVWLIMALVVTMLLLLGTISYLGRQPDLFISPQTDFGPSWQFAIDSNRRIAISMPRSWQRVEAMPPPIAPLLAEIAPDAVWHFIHFAPDGDSFTMIGESGALHQETADSVLSRLTIAGEMSEAEQTQSLNGKPTLTTQTIRAGLTCQWQIVRSDTDYILLGCNIPPISLQEQQTNGKILNSFQQLN